MGRQERAVKGTLASVIQYGLQIILQIILSPLLLKVAGQEVLGVYAILIQTLGYLTLLDMGFSISISRFLAQSFGYEDHGEAFRSILTTGRTFLLGTNILFSLATICLSIFIANIFHLSTGVQNQARISLWLLAGWAILRTPIGVYGNALIAVQDLAFRNTLTAMVNGIRLVASIVLVSLGFGLIGLILSNLLAEAFDLLLCFWRFKRLYPEKLPGWKIINVSLFRDLLKFSGPVMVMNIALRLILYTDNIVASILFGASAASIYYSTQMPTLMGWNMILKIADNASPGINELYARNEQNRLKLIFIQLSRYTFMLAIPFSIAVIIFNRYLINIWVGPNQYGGEWMTIALALYAIMIISSHLNKAFIMASGRIKVLSFIELFEGLTNLILSFILGSLIGLPGIMIGTVVAALPTVIYSQIKVNHDLNLTSNEFFRCIYPVAIKSIPIGMLLFIVLHFWMPKNLASLLMISITYILLHAIVFWFTIIEKSERIKVLGTIKQYMISPDSKIFS